MRRRLDQLVETNRRYGHPFALAVFDASGPGTRNGDGGGQETVLAIVGAALRDSIRIVDEAFRLEEDAICVLAPNLTTVEGVQMAERLLVGLDELERAGGCGSRSRPASSPVPKHGADAELLLHKADAAMWRARARRAAGGRRRFARSLTDSGNLSITDVNLNLRWENGARARITRATTFL